jgi:transcriptional regulator with XRE-family HTH domain
MLNPSLEKDFDMSQELRMTVFNKAVGQWLHDARTKKGLTPEQAAERIGAETEHILAIESGRESLSGQDLYALMAAYKISTKKANRFLQTFGMSCG